VEIAVETSEWQDAPRPSGCREALFAIGDVHGYAAHLRALHERLRDTIRSDHSAADTLVVWLGDYIDRGPDPLGCLDLVSSGLGLPGIREAKLRGNHECYLTEAVDADDYPEHALMHWIANGGGETIAGILPGRARPNARELPGLLRDAMGPERRHFLASLTVFFRAGNYVFAHAGVDPARPLEGQRESDLLWIRDPFLDCLDWPHDAVVVHGHTPEGPEVLSHRICVDSGVYFRGRLTAVEIVEDRLRFHSAVAGGRDTWI